VLSALKWRAVMARTPGWLHAAAADGIMYDR
jgi:hypothetical protein